MAEKNFVNFMIHFVGLGQLFVTYDTVRNWGPVRAHRATVDTWAAV